MEDVLNAAYAAADKRPIARLFNEMVKERYGIHAQDHDFSQAYDLIRIVEIALKNAKLQLTSASLANDRISIRDAIAGILILVINIIGGLIIGSVQHDLTLEDSAEKYILLTVGDGLVAQIPSLLLALATATIVTRIGSDEKDLSGQISSQMGMSKAWVPVSGVLFLFGLVPGMPNTLFLLAGGISGILAWRFNKKKIENDTKANDTKDEKDENPEKINVDDVSDNSAISLDLGYGLISLVDSDLSEDLPGSEEKKNR